MSPWSIVALSLAASTDAFAAALGRGATASRVSQANSRDVLRAALITGITFGVIEGLTPILGWLIGSAAVSWVQAWDHWLAFGILAGLGANSIWQSFGDGAIPETSRPSGFWAMATAALATSMDAMAMGLSLAFVDVSIWVVATAIGITTMAMAALGYWLGGTFGSRWGSWAERLGGVLLILVGSHILWSHLKSSL